MLALGQDVALVPREEAAAITLICRVDLEGVSPIVATDDLPNRCMPIRLNHIRDGELQLADGEIQISNLGRGWLTNLPDGTRSTVRIIREHNESRLSNRAWPESRAHHCSTMSRSAAISLAT